MPQADPSFSRRPIKSKRTLVSVAVIAAILLIVAGVAFKDRLFDGGGPARALASQYVKELSAGNESAALADAHASLSGAEVRASIDDVKKYGSLEGLEFDDASRTETDGRAEWLLKGVARFAQSKPRFEMRLRQVGQALKVVGLTFPSAQAPSPSPPAENAPTPARTVAGKAWNAPPAMAIDPHKKYAAIIETIRGTITLALFPGEAPKTVNNFVFLARAGFYDGLTFHRVIPDFMIQGGDPTATGSGGPGYQFEDETDPATNPRVFKTGSLAMANAGPATNGSQFFITHKPTEWLQGKHTIFGQVADAKSQDVVNAIQQGDVMKTIKIEEEGATSQPATAPGK